MGHRPALEHASRTRNNRPARRCRRKAREMTDLLCKFDALIAAREGLLDSDVRATFSPVMEKVNSPPEAIISGQTAFVLGTSHYLDRTIHTAFNYTGNTTIHQIFYSHN